MKELEEGNNERDERVKKNCNDNHFTVETETCNHKFYTEFLLSLLIVEVYSGFMLSNQVQSSKN